MSEVVRTHDRMLAGIVADSEGEIRLAPECGVLGRPWPGETVQRKATAAITAR
jgi:hypothetical protein